MNTRSGTASVEAAILFPIIILVAMFTVYMAIGWYSECSLRSSLHEEVRIEADSRTGKTKLTVTSDVAKDIYRAAAQRLPVRIDEHNSFSTSYVAATANMRYRSGMITNYATLSREYVSRFYLVDEKKRLLVSSW